MDGNFEQELQQQVRDAYQCKRGLNIVGGSSKLFYGREAIGNDIHTTTHCGIIDYDPAELVITARAGTSISVLQERLLAQDQMLGFEPPKFIDSTTLGGVVAAGLAGPRRPYVGAVRDFVLGVKILNGRGELMRFGGTVMKNVAGFDVSRLMVGALGTLGVLLEVSLRVIPRPQIEKTLVLSKPKRDDAIAFFNQLAARPLPLSAAVWSDGEARIRLSGSAATVESTAKSIGGDMDASLKFWEQLRDHQLPFFHSECPLLRVSVPPAAVLPLGTDPCLVDWGGAQYWIASQTDIAPLRNIADKHGGHLTVFRHGDRQSTIFQPLVPAVHALHIKLKRAFDPAGILNFARMYPQV